MVTVSMLWLNRLLFSSWGTTPLPAAHRKPMEIQVERLPDYLWRDLGFWLPRRPEEK